MPTTFDPPDSASPAINTEVVVVASSGEEATAGMKRKDPPTTTLLSSLATPSSSSNSSMRTSSSLLTLNNLLPTPTNLSNLLTKTEENSKDSSEMENNASTISTGGESPFVGAAKVTSTSRPTDGVVPPTLICKPPSASVAPCWAYFRLFDPSHHPDLESYVQCMLCDARISRGGDRSTGGMNKHLMYKHIKEYKEMKQEEHQNKTKSAPTTTKITNHFAIKEKKSTSEMKQLFTVAAITCASENGLPLDLFTRPSFRNMFAAISKTANQVVNISHSHLRKEVLVMGLIAEEAVLAEIRDKRVSYTSDHWTGPNDETYTTVTAHYIDTNVWEMKSMCLDFKVFSGRTTGENIYNDIQGVLQKFMRGEFNFV